MLVVGYLDIFLIRAATFPTENGSLGGASPVTLALMSELLVPDAGARSASFRGIVGMGVKLVGEIGSELWSSRHLCGGCSGAGDVNPCDMQATARSKANCRQ